MSYWLVGKIIWWFIMKIREHKGERGKTGEKGTFSLLGGNNIILEEGGGVKISYFGKYKHPWRYIHITYLQNILLKCICYTGVGFIRRSCTNNNFQLGFYWLSGLFISGSLFHLPDIRSNCLTNDVNFEWTDFFFRTFSISIKKSEIVTRNVGRFYWKIKNFTFFPKQSFFILVDFSTFRVHVVKESEKKDKKKKEGNKKIKDSHKKKLKICKFRLTATTVDLWGLFCWPKYIYLKKFTIILFLWWGAVSPH